MALNNKIKDFTTIFATDDSPNIKITKTKVSLAQMKPVVIGIGLKENFFDIEKGEKFWYPQIGNQASAGAHAMVVVGYDDTKFTGAFEVMNSWGEDWGNGGFMWVRYKDFAEFTRYAFELFVLTGTNPDAIDLAGEVEKMIKSSNAYIKKKVSKMYIEGAICTG